MDPRKASAEWFRSTVFREEAIRPRAAQPAERVPSAIRAARSLENGAYQSWQSRESLFLKQAKLLAGYEDDYDGGGGAMCYYPTYQSLTDPQLRAYFSWRTKVRGGEIRKTCLSFAFLYIYELLNQIGAADPADGYCRLERFRDAYGQLDGGILPYLERWLPDYVIYYGLDRALLSDTRQAALDRCADVLEHVREREPAEVGRAVRPLSGWLGRSSFYAEHQDDMDAVITRVLRRMSDHYAARCKKSLVEQYFGGYGRCAVYLFDAAVFCDPLKRRTYEYALDGQCVYQCRAGSWSVWKRTGAPGPGRALDALAKTVDSVMRQEYGCRPVKAGLDTKWILRAIQEEVRALLAEKKSAEERKVTIRYEQLAGIRRDAAITREKLIVEEEAEPPVDPILPAPGPERTEPAPAAGESLLSPPEYRLLQCLLYGGDTGWVQAEGRLLSVLVDGINETLYDQFQDCVLDGTPQPIPDYIDELKGMVHP